MVWPRRRSNSRISRALTGLSSASRILRPLPAACTALPASALAGGVLFRQKRRRAGLRSGGGGCGVGGGVSVGAATSYPRRLFARPRDADLQPLQQRDFAHRLDQITVKAHRLQRIQLAARRRRHQHQSGNVEFRLDEGHRLGLGAGIDQDGVDRPLGAM